MSLRELRRHVGRFAVVGFNGVSVPADLRALIAEFDLGGVIYFPRNLGQPHEIAELSREVSSLARDWPFWISVDQEGGSVARLRAPFTIWPPAQTLGRSGDPALARRFGEALADELGAVGINLDYAPVLDVHTNPANPVIGARALSERADQAAELGAVIIRALEDHGVAACGKHFPGHGDTSVDSHETLPVIEHDRRRLDAVELMPFHRAVAEHVALIMTAHVMVPALDERNVASFSWPILQHLLKEALGYDGVVVSDDLGMKAVADTHDLAEASVAAVAAGCDALLMCNSTVDAQVSALEALIRAAEDGRLKQPRIDDAMARQHRVKARLLAGRSKRIGSLDCIGCDAHQAVAREMAAWQ